MNLTDLQHVTGHGTSANGDILSPATIRHLACDAGIIPAVLGSDSELLHLGREERLATPAQVIALRHRDNGCSYPGCDRPSGWCQAHQSGTGSTADPPTWTTSPSCVKDTTRSCTNTGTPQP